MSQSQNIQRLIDIMFSSWWDGVTRPHKYPLTGLTGAREMVSSSVLWVPDPRLLWVLSSGVLHWGSHRTKICSEREGEIWKLGIYWSAAWDSLKVSLLSFLNLNILESRSLFCSVQSSLLWSLSQNDFWKHDNVFSLIVIVLCSEPDF